MKVKLNNNYRFSPNGIAVFDLQKGDIVEGEVAKVLEKAGAAKKTETKAAAVFNDNGPVVADVAYTATIECKGIAVLADQVQAQKKELADLKGEVSDLRSVLDDFIEQKPLDKSDGDSDHQE
jgi:hypothetical protein